MRGCLAEDDPETLRSRWMDEDMCELVQAPEGGRPRAAGFVDEAVDVDPRWQGTRWGTTGDVKLGRQAAFVEDAGHLDRPIAAFAYPVDPDEQQSAPVSRSAIDEFGDFITAMRDLHVCAKRQHLHPCWICPVILDSAARSPFGREEGDFCTTQPAGFEIHPLPNRPLAQRTVIRIEPQHRREGRVRPECDRQVGTQIRNWDYPGAEDEVALHLVEPLSNDRGVLLCDLWIAIERVAL